MFVTVDILKLANYDSDERLFKHGCSSLVLHKLEVSEHDMISILCRGLLNLTSISVIINISQDVESELKMFPTNSFLPDFPKIPWPLVILPGFFPDHEKNHFSLTFSRPVWTPAIGPTDWKPLDAWPIDPTPPQILGRLVGPSPPCNSLWLRKWTEERQEYSRLSSWFSLQCLSHLLISISYRFHVFILHPSFASYFSSHDLFP